MKRLLLLLAMVALVPGGARAQSLFATSGLGVPLAPLDARARALGGIGLGLFGFNPSMVNPAEISGVRYRGVVAAFQPFANSVSFGGDEDEIGGTRFPLIRVIYPFSPRLVGSIGYGSVLDQSWDVVSEGTILVGSDSLSTRDEIRSVGGIAQMQVGAAYLLGGGVSVGAAVGTYTGDLQRTSTRSFPDEEIPGIEGFTSRTIWNYTGPLVVVGARWNVRSIATLSASYAWSGTLEADSVEGGGADREFDVPGTLSLGASATLAPRLALTVGVRRAPWSSIGADLDVRDVTEYGGGVEWEGMQVSGRRLPLRFGYHRMDLPFDISGAPGSEHSFSGGLGVRMALTDDGPMATADAGIERGSRSAGALTEDFWRFTASLALFGR